ncbi:MAG: choice-of-anchor tandem repeat GloVer-containing protein [Chthoniobacteraceae bacterium]
MALKVAALFCTLLASAGAQTFETVYSLRGDQLEGRRIAAALTVGADGALYGTATEGGAGGSGTAFKVTTGGAFTLLGSFETATTGRFPYARLVNVGDGFLYGVTERNGNVAGDPAGTVYRLNPAGGLTTIFPLPGTGVAPKFPRSLISALPNTLHVLGANPGGIWQVPLDGSQPTSSLLSSNEIGAFPYNLVRGNDGLLYGGTEGVTVGGSGTNLRGTLFRVAPDGSGLTRLHECQVATGTSPYGAMVQAADGSFYGTMAGGGASLRGTIFRLSSAGYTVIHHFSDLSAPRGDLLLASDGYLYGTTRSGGSAGLGGIFRIRPDGSGYQTVHVFSGGDGSMPWGGLVQAPDGHLYGTTYEGGSGANGTIYRLRLGTPPVSQNHAPVAIGDLGVVTDGPVLIPVLANDFDADEDPLEVAITVPPAFGTAEVQANGSILYTPGPSYTDADEFTYSITDPEGQSAQANVLITSTTPTALVQPGVYNGLLNLDPSLDGSGTLPRAQFGIVVTANGSFSGVITAGRKRMPVRGFFEEDGTAIAGVRFSKKSQGVLFLGFRPDEPGSLLGIVVGTELWLGDARPLQDRPANLPEQFTALTESVNVPPAGLGYALMRVYSNGLVGAVGRHADGTKLSWSTSLVTQPDGSIAMPVFDEPVKGGVCAGVLIAPDSSAETFAGALRWVRPASAPNKPYGAGFDGQLTAVASSFTPAASAVTVLDFGNDAAGTITIGEGYLASPAASDFGISENKATAAAPISKLTINRKKGTFKGTAKVDGATLKFGGVVNQQGNVAAGHFTFAGETGPVVIQP